MIATAKMLRNAHIAHDTPAHVCVRAFDSETPVAHLKTHTRRFEIDPTHTITIRRKWAENFSARLQRVSRTIRKYVLDNMHTVMNNAQFVREASSVAEQAIDNELEITSGGKWQNKYVERAYLKGVNRAVSELKKIGIHVEQTDDGLRVSAIDNSAVNRVVHAEAIDSIELQAFQELKGIGPVIETQLVRTLGEGIAEGLGAEDVARNIDNNIKSINRTRARVIARTETVRAHHKGTINTYREAGVEGVKLKAEFATAGDSLVCEMCASLEGKVYALNAVENTIPVHPNCRCVALPVLTDKFVPKGDELIGGPARIRSRAIPRGRVGAPPVPVSLGNRLPDIVDETLEAAAERAAYDKFRSGNMTLIRQEELLETKMAQAFDEADVYIALETESIQAVTKSGRFKTQFETNKSGGGLLDPEERADAERILFGYDVDLPKKERPVYGVFSYEDDIAAKFGGGKMRREKSVQAPIENQYGSSVIKLKPQAKNRSTYNGTDSLDTGKDMGFPNQPTANTLYDSWDEGVPYDRQIDFYARRIKKDTDPKDVFFHMNHDEHFVEAQIHRGVNLDDIDEVILGNKKVYTDIVRGDYKLVPDTLPQATIDALHGSGIKVYRLELPDSTGKVKKTRVEPTKKVEPPPTPVVKPTKPTVVPVIDDDLLNIETIWSEDLENALRGYVLRKEAKKRGEKAHPDHWRKKAIAAGWPKDIKVITTTAELDELIARVAGVTPKPKPIVTPKPTPKPTPPAVKPKPEVVVPDVPEVTEISDELENALREYVLRKEAQARGEKAHPDHWRKKAIAAGWDKDVKLPKTTAELDEFLSTVLSRIDQPPKAKLKIDSLSAVDKKRRKMKIAEAVEDPIMQAEARKLFLDLEHSKAWTYEERNAKAIMDSAGMEKLQVTKVQNKLKDEMYQKKDMVYDAMNVYDAEGNAVWGSKGVMEANNVWRQSDEYKAYQKYMTEVAGPVHDKYNKAHARFTEITVGDPDKNPFAATPMQQRQHEVLFEKFDGDLKQKVGGPIGATDENTRAGINVEHKWKKVTKKQRKEMTQKAQMAQDFLERVMTSAGSLKTTNLEDFKSAIREGLNWFMDQQTKSKMVGKNLRGSDALKNARAHFKKLAKRKSVTYDYTSSGGKGLHKFDRTSQWAPGGSPKAAAAIDEIFDEMDRMLAIDDAYVFQKAMQKRTHANKIIEPAATTVEQDIRLQGQFFKASWSKADDGKDRIDGAIRWREKQGPHGRKDLPEDVLLIEQFGSMEKKLYNQAGLIEDVYDQADIAGKKHVVYIQKLTGDKAIDDAVEEFWIQMGFSEEMGLGAKNIYPQLKSGERMLVAKTRHAQDDYYDTPFFEKMKESRDARRQMDSNKAVTDDMAARRQKAKGDGFYDDIETYVDVSEDGRSSAETVSNQINMSLDATVKIWVHEVGHHMEVDQHTLNRATEFLKWRTKGEKARKLSIITGNDRYDPWEVAKPDKFCTPYIGRIYGKGQSTEVISMGLQYMYDDPVKFYKCDPAHFTFMMGIMTQRL